MIKRSLLLLVCISVAQLHAQQKQLFNTNWEFIKDIDTVFSQKLLGAALPWQKIALPHTAHIEPVEKKAQQWQGICFYRKFFTLPVTAKGKHIAIQFEAAMQEAHVYVNGVHVYKHVGGYLPFYIDLSDKIKFGTPNSIVVQLDNRDNPLIPPGKTLKTLDFNYYSGIYRNAWLITKEKIYIPDAVAANRVAGGGVLVFADAVSPQSATLQIRTAIVNDKRTREQVQMRTTLTDTAGKRIAMVLSPVQWMEAGAAASITQTMQVQSPLLWSPDHPYLYQLTIEALQNGKLIDKEVVATGIKKVRIQNNTFFLNDTKLTIRGTNRHQDYPYIGNALSDNAQYRDAWKIKQAGFNFVRSSHYPQSPAFLQACDELGLLVMDAIPGWQYYGNDSFRTNSYQDIRDMIRRDRNHASVVLWEASLNESGMKKDYMQKAHAIVHEELPFDGVYSAGWINDVFDVFLPARQHAKAPDYWKKYDQPRALLIAEYGDWEYYAQNAGFNQTAYKDLKLEERTSRQLRGFGEKRLLQQALNYQESHNDNLSGASLGDANWLMFDYNRGYADDIESSGIMDIFRLPKFSFYFYQSQGDPVMGHPMVYIANYWQSNSDTTIRVFSNCEEVELLLNGKRIARQQPDSNQYSTNLAHPPFTFRVPAFQAGTLIAIGYINKQKAAEHHRATPGAPAAIQLRVDYSGKPLQSNCNDVVFVYAEITDKNGTVVYDASQPIEFSVSGDAELIGQNPRTAEAGTATTLLRSGAKADIITVTAKGAGFVNQIKVPVKK
jgi:beta-galactosidase